MNNKGQTLIFFVILLPIILFVFIFLVDLANMNYEKNKLNNLAYALVSYKLDYKSDDDIKDILNKNDKDVICNITYNGVELKKKYKPIFFKILGSDEFITSKYTGYIKNGKKVIKKVI
jgi:hypothetical protein